MDAESINKKDRYGRTLLHRALYQNEQELVTKLLATPGINVNIKTDNSGGTALDYACEKNNTKALKLLLAAPDIEVNVPDKKGSTPIMKSAARCNKEALKLLADDHRVNLDGRVTSNKEDTLEMLVGSICGTAAQQIECSELIKKSRKLRAKEEMTLLKLMRNLSDSRTLNAKDDNGRNLLHRSLHQNNRKAVVSLLSAPGIDVNAKTNYGCSPLTFACCKNNTQAVKLLLRAPGVDVNSIDVYGRTPIMATLANRSRKSVKLMLDDYRVDLDEVNSNDGTRVEDWICGTSPEKIRYLEMIKKAKNGRMKENQILSKLLKARNAKALNERDEHGRNLLHRSLHHNNTEAIATLLHASGIDVNIATTESRGTPLIYACQNNNTEAMAILLESPGILVNVRDKFGRSAIMVALAWCSREALKLLVKDPRVDLDQRIKSSSGRKLGDWAGEYSKDGGYGEYGETAKRECLEIIHEARRTRASIDELRNKIVDLEIRQAESQKTLECPVCLESMRPPTRIWMCSLSHIVCEPCENRLTGRLCPECRNERVTLRAFVAESFARTVFN